MLPVTVAGQTTQRLRLPAQFIDLEEANLPPDMARELAGCSVDVQVLPEEMPGTRAPLPGEPSRLIDPEGNHWNDYLPLRVIFHDSHGRDWRLPRHWLEGRGSSEETAPDTSYAVHGPLQFVEKLHLPSYWDLIEINLPEREADRAAGRSTSVRVCLAPGDPVKVFWHDPNGAVWRIPHNWRRRRVRLPGRETLLEQGVPWDVAGEYSNRIVSVNYHPGSLCCLPDCYRFRDSEGNPYPVRIQDCVLLGYGDAAEHLA